MLMFELLRKKKKIKLSKTNAYKKYDANKKVLSKVKRIYDFHEKDNAFNIVCYNLLIEAIKTKDDVLNMLDKLKTLDASKQKIFLNDYYKNRPYFSLNEEKIYLPQYFKSLNYVFYNEPLKLENEPYSKIKLDPCFSCYDFFDEYGYKIFNSGFTDLIFLSNDKTSGAFYHKEFEMIFIINDQGRLDQTIALFDKYKYHVNKDNLIERLKVLVNAYYNSSRIEFVDCLYQQKFISRYMRLLLTRNILKRKQKKEEKMKVKK